MCSTPPPDDLHHAVLAWFRDHRRDLPWRVPGIGAWPVLVSEVMLQQTPVSRVEPVWRAWMERWPTPSHLAAAGPGDAVRAWGRLGYPRRALRLRECAGAVVDGHGGEVPREPEHLLALPGIGAYTAAAVAAFAFGDRVAVLDTNVRRVLARVLGGDAGPAVSIRRAEVERAEAVLPADPAAASAWSVAVMELGALVCTARSPRCADCPVASICAWRAAGFPPSAALARRPQAWHGTDRQARGRLMAVLRDADHVDRVSPSRLASAWPDGEQRSRALASLLADGLVEQVDGGFRLPIA